MEKQQNVQQKQDLTASNFTVHITICHTLFFPVESTTEQMSMAEALKTEADSHWSVSVRSVRTCRKICRCLWELMRMMIIWKMDLQSKKWLNSVNLQKKQVLIHLTYPEEIFFRQVSNMRYLRLIFQEHLTLIMLQRSVKKQECWRSVSEESIHHSLQNRFWKMIK